MFFLTKFLLKKQPAPCAEAFEAARSLKKGVCVERALHYADALNKAGYQAKVLDLTDRGHEVVEAVVTIHADPTTGEWDWGPQPNANVSPFSPGAVIHEFPAELMPKKDGKDGPKS